MIADSSDPASARPAVEPAAPDSGEWLRLVLESLTEYAIFTVDTEGRINTWNTGAKRVLGYHEAEIVGQPVDVLFTAEARAQGVPQGEMRQALETGRAGDDRWHLRRDGSRFWASGIMTPLRDEQGRAQGFVKILRDMTDQKLAQERLQARARQQTAVSEFGQLALGGAELPALLSTAADTVCRTLDSDLCKVLCLTPDGAELELAAGVGWRDGLVGEARVSAAADESPVGYALRSPQPVVFEDLREERRSPGARLLREHGVVSGLMVSIAGRSGEQPWGVLATYTRTRRGFSPDDIHFLQSMANILAGAIHRMEAEQRLQDLNETLEAQVVARTLEARRRTSQLQSMAVKLSQAEQRERRRLAQMLHDHLQQLLVAARMHLVAVGRRLQDPAIAADLGRVTQLLDQSLESSRKLTVELSPTVLYESGLVAALQWLGRWMLENYELKVELQADETLELDDEEVRVLAFQSVRELLFNIVKHAGACAAQVRLRLPGERHLEIIVEDAGHGFDPVRVREDPDAAGGFGLFGIQERLEAIGGQVEIWSRPRQGTRVTLRVPRSANGE